MKPHLLIAVDAFNETHIQTIADSVAGWATWERLPEAASPETFGGRLAVTEIMIGWPEPEWLLPSPIKLLLCPSAGYETYLGHGLESKPGFTFCNAGETYSEGVAGHCLAMMMALARRLPEYIHAMRAKTWRHLNGHADLSGASVCIVGLGGIGLALARRCAALDMTVTGVRRNPNPVGDTVQKVYPVEHLAEAVAGADHVVAALPGGKATAHLFNREVFSAMKPGAYFYNVGRGSVVDEPELIRHLVNGHLTGAGLDVFESEPLPPDSPLWTMPNVIVTPHMAGYTADYADQLCDMMAANLRRYHQRQPLVNVISLGRNDR